VAVLRAPSQVVVGALLLHMVLYLIKSTHRQTEAKRRSRRSRRRWVRTHLEVDLRHEVAAVSSVRTPDGREVARSLVRLAQPELDGFRAALVVEHPALVRKRTAVGAVHLQLLYQRLG
jgi:hypothetical protein